MQEVLTYMMNTFGYLGVCFLIAIENIFPPIPSEVILTFGGFMTLSGRVGIKPGTAGACDGKPDVSKAWF